MLNRSLKSSFACIALSANQFPFNHHAPSGRKAHLRIHALPEFFVEFPRFVSMAGETSNNTTFFHEGDLIKPYIHLL